MNQILKQEKDNTGFIAEFEPKIWVAGQETGIATIDRLQGREWGSYLPSEERQKKATLDVMACVTFSALNSVETQLNFLKSTRQIPESILEKCREYGFLENDIFNFSDRFTAKMSGTTINGNTLGKVWESIRTDGLIPEKDWSFTEGVDWSEYYSEIPQTLKDKAKKFLELFSIQYELVGFGNINYTPEAEIKTHLKHAPLQIAAPVCWPWNTSELIGKCEITNAGHATLLFGFEEKKDWEIYDHYNPFKKFLAWNYNIPFVMKGVVSIKTPESSLNPTKPERFIFNRDLEFGMSGADVANLQDWLKFLGYMNKQVKSTGYFGTITKIAIQDFQIDKLVAKHGEPGFGRFGPRTRGKMNLISGV